VVVCCLCGKPIASMPAWLESVKVDFQCLNCRNPQSKQPARQPRTAPVKAGPELPELTVTEDADVFEDY
jgi:hypothetical protein